MLFYNQFLISKKLRKISRNSIPQNLSFFHLITITHYLCFHTYIHNIIHTDTISYMNVHNITCCVICKRSYIFTSFLFSVLKICFYFYFYFYLPFAFCYCASSLQNKTYLMDGHFLKVPR